LMVVALWNGNWVRLVHSTPVVMLLLMVVDILEWELGSYFGLMSDSCVNIMHYVVMLLLLLMCIL
jgi:hypothetical protein